MAALGFSGSGSGSGSIGTAVVPLAVVAGIPGQDSQRCGGSRPATVRSWWTRKDAVRQASGRGGNGPGAGRPCRGLAACRSATCRGGALSHRTPSGSGKAAGGGAGPFSRRLWPRRFPEAVTLRSPGPFPAPRPTGSPFPCCPVGCEDGCGRRGNGGVRKRILVSCARIWPPAACKGVKAPGLCPTRSSLPGGVADELVALGSGCPAVAEARRPALVSGSRLSHSP